MRSPRSRPPIVLIGMRGVKRQRRRELARLVTALILTMLLIRMLTLLAALDSVILLCPGVSSVCLVMLVIRSGLANLTSSGHAVRCRRGMILRKSSPMHPPRQQWVLGLLLPRLLLLLQLLVRRDCDATASLAVAGVMLILLLNVMHGLLIRIDRRELRVAAVTVEHLPKLLILVYLHIVGIARVR